ncbi:hypothetical protein BBJ28_00001338 [Nothophytophthora sp. Chile5]|nr:hypothetical protein BBJ28_00001338 [Nothophytophthora sp. Chile5]
MTNTPSMGEDAAGSIEVRSYGELQAKLRAMAYNEPVGVESVPLVKRMLADLMAASAAREKTERALEKAQRDALEFSQILLPLRKENAQLTRENNSIIHQEEAITEREKACELQLEGQRDDIKKLQFVNGQKAQQCLQKRLLATGIGGNLSHSASIEMKGSDASQSLRRLSIESQQTSRKMPQTGERSRAQTQVAKDLQEQLAELTAENTKLRSQCDQFNEKLSKREQEINRLSKLSVQMVSSEENSTRKLHELEERYEMRSKQDAADLQVEQLSTQVDLLNDQVAKYESRLKEATEQIRRNGGIAEKLQYV